MSKPNLLGPGGRKRVPCLCSFCATLFRGYQRWIEKGHQECPGCHMSGTGFVRQLSPQQMRLINSWVNSWGKEKARMSLPEIPFKPTQETPWEQMCGSLYAMQNIVANLREGISDPQDTADQLDQQLNYLLKKFPEHFGNLPWSGARQEQLDKYLGRKK